MRCQGRTAFRNAEIDTNRTASRQTERRDIAKGLHPVIVPLSRTKTEKMESLLGDRFSGRLDRGFLACLAQHLDLDLRGDFAVQFH